MGLKFLGPIEPAREGGDKIEETKGMNGQGYSFESPWCLIAVLFSQYKISSAPNIFCGENGSIISSSR